MQKTSSELLDLVGLELERIEYTREPSRLYEPIRYVLSMGGKRVRPVLLLLAYQLYKDDVAPAMSAAMALETYHNYMLLHDDLMDNASVRRGRATVHEKWDINSAILSGDSMLVLAYEWVGRCAPDKLKALLDLFTTTALEIGEGQQYDIDFESRMDVSEEEYIEMIRLKTSVLLACATKMGALIGGGTSEDAELLYAFGEQLGLAFQLQDDYLAVYGDEATFGKRIGGDILCNKKTYMLINALRLAKGEQREQLDRWIGSTCPNETEKIAAVTALYNELGIAALCRKKIAYYFSQAEICLNKVSLPQARKAELWHYAQSLMTRES